MPRVYSFAARKIVEDEIDIRQHLCQQNNLTSVHLKVFGYMQNRRQGRRHRSLNPKLF